MARLIDRIQNAVLGGAGADKMRELLIELNIPLGGSGDNAMRDIRKSILYSTDSEDELRTGMGNLGLTGVSTGVRPMPRIRAAILLNRSDSEPQLRAAIDDLLGESASQAPTDIALSNSTVAEDVALGTVVGELTATDPESGPVTFSLVGDSEGYFDISGDNLIVSRVLDYEAAPSHSITVRATDEDALTYDEPFTIAVTNVTEPSTGDDPPPADGEIIHDNTFDNPPIVTEVGGNIKLHGNKGSGSTGKFIYNIGPFLPGYKYTMSYEPDFALLTLQGKKAMVGFGLKQGNDFRLTGLKGDGSTGLKAYEISGDGLWTATSGFTETDGGAVQHGTQAGPNWLQIEISADGTTYTQRTSSDGETWAAEFTDVVPAPFADVEEATQGGIAVFFDGTDTGKFSVAITLWTAASAAVPQRNIVVPVATSRLEVDWANPINRLLFDSVVFSQGGQSGLRNLVTGQRVVPTATPSWATTLEGAAGQSTGTAYYTWPDHGNMAAGDLTARFRFAVVSTYYDTNFTGLHNCLISKGSYDGELFVTLNQGSTFIDATALQFIGIGGGNNNSVGLTSFRRHQVVDLVLARSGTTVTAYQDGVNKGTFPVAGTAAKPGSAYELGITFDYPNTNKFLVFQTWRRALSQSEVRMLAMNPYFGLRQARRL